MQKIILLSLFVVALLPQFLSPVVAADTNALSPATEARGLWLHPLTDFNVDPNKGKPQIHKFVNRVADANFNFILPWITSEYVAALTDTNYQNANPAAEWDMLGELISAARERHLPVHIWYSFTYYKLASSPEFNPKTGGDPNWGARAVDVQKKVSAPMTDVCTSQPKAREWQLNLIEKLIERYPDIAGIHIEEPGYGYANACACDVCRSVFKNLYGTELNAGITSEQAEDLKCAGTTEFIRQLRSRLLKRNPKIVFSVNGGTAWRGDRALGRDWRHWAEFGWLDYYAAQCYTDDAGAFTSGIRGVVTDLTPNASVFAGIHIKSSSGVNPLPSILREIEIARQSGTAGVVLFSAASLTDEHLAALKNGPFKAPAVYPGPKR